VARAWEACVVELAAPRDENKFAGLLLASRLIPQLAAISKQPTSIALSRVVTAVGSQFLRRLLETRERGAEGLHQRLALSLISLLCADADSRAQGREFVAGLLRTLAPPSLSASAAPSPPDITVDAAKCILALVEDGASVRALGSERVSWSLLEHALLHSCDLAASPLRGESGGALARPEHELSTLAAALVRAFLLEVVVRRGEQGDGDATVANAVLDKALARLASGFRKIHDAGKFELLSILVFLCEQMRLHALGAPRPSYLTDLAVGLADVLRSRVALAARHEALIASASLVERAGADWLAEQVQLLPPLLNCCSVECRVLIEEQTVTERKCGSEAEEARKLQALCATFVIAEALMDAVAAGDDDERAEGPGDWRVVARARISEIAGTAYAFLENIAEAKRNEHPLVAAALRLVSEWEARGAELALPSLANLLPFVFSAAAAQPEAGVLAMLLPALLPLALLDQTRQPTGRAAFDTAACLDAIFCAAEQRWSLSLRSSDADLLRLAEFLLALRLLSDAIAPERLAAAATALWKFSAHVAGCMADAPHRSTARLCFLHACDLGVLAVQCDQCDMAAAGGAGVFWARFWTAAATGWASVSSTDEVDAWRRCFAGVARLLQRPASRAANSAAQRALDAHFLQQCAHFPQDMVSNDAREVARALDPVLALLFAQDPTPALEASERLAHFFPMLQRAVVAFATTR
jgi:hypothetical protein